MNSTNKTAIFGVHDFDWLYAQARGRKTRSAIERIIAIEKSYMDGKPLIVSDHLVELRLGDNRIWTRENTAHSIPFGYVQIFKLLGEILPDSFKQPMHNMIVDVGANEGHWSLYMHGEHPEARVVAIEPNPTALELLRKNFKSNGLEGATVLPFAVSDREEAIQFETIDNVTSLGSFAIDRTGRPWLTDERIKKITVDCRTLDALVSPYRNEIIDLLKIDVEGAELKVIDGAKATLARTQRIEVEYGSEENQQALISILTGHGFRLALDHNYSVGRGDLFLCR